MRSGACTNCATARASASVRRNSARSARFMRASRRISDRRADQRKRSALLNDWTNLGEAVRLRGRGVYPLTLLAIGALAITLDRAYAFWRFAHVPSGVSEALEHAGGDDGDR